VKIPEFPDLRPLTNDDHEMLVELLAAATPAICDLSPANLFIWRDCERPSLTLVGDSLCILVEPHLQPAFFLEPVGGSWPVDAVRTCLTRADRISRSSKALVDTLSTQEFDVRPLRDHFDYIYRLQALAELKGKKFDGKRNQIRKFTANFPDYDFRPLERPQFDNAMALFRKWGERRGGDAAPADSPSFSYECQHHALERAFHDYERLDLVGGAISVRGELQGFIIASTARAETAVVHFQYANADLSGIYQVLLRDACRNLFAGCTYANLEEDLGLAGLRRTKLSYLPLRLEEKYEIRARVPGLQNAVFGPKQSPEAHLQNDSPAR
jgi:hypothetical protein